MPTIQLKKLNKLMSLTEEEKRKIEEEESYRVSLKQSPVKKKGLNGWVIFILIFVGLPFLITVFKYIYAAFNHDSVETPQVIMLNGNIEVAGNTLRVTNNEDRTWNKCVFEINNTYKLPMVISRDVGIPVEPKETVKLQLGEFKTTSSVLFNQATQKITTVTVTCPSEGFLKVNFK